MSDQVVSMSTSDKTWTLPKNKELPGVNYRLCLRFFRIVNCFRNCPRGGTLVLNGVKYSIPAYQYTGTTLATQINLIIPTTIRILYDANTVGFYFTNASNAPINVTIGAETSTVLLRLLGFSTSGTFQKSNVCADLNGVTTININCDLGIEQFTLTSRLGSVPVTAPFGSTNLYEDSGGAFRFLVNDHTFNSIRIWLTDQYGNDLSNYTDTTSDPQNYIPPWQITLSIDPIITESSTPLGIAGPPMLNALAYPPQHHLFE